MRDVDTLKGLHGLKTMAASKRRSITDAKTPAYLELYMMDKEKERLEKEGQRLEMRHAQIKARLQEIELFRKQTQKTAKRGEIENTAGAPERNSGKEWKKMSLHY